MRRSVRSRWCARDDLPYAMGATLWGWAYPGAHPPPFAMKPEFVWLVVAILAAVYVMRQTSIVDQIARAIAKAEGFYVPGSKPQRYNNPGALIDPTTGDLRRFATVDEGWEALRKYIREKILPRTGPYANAKTIYDVARIYTGGDKPEAWSAIVAGELGKSPNDWFVGGVSA